MAQKTKYLILLLIVTISSLATAGYFFAMKKSAPEYSSKIDKIMFEHENKSPKFILTLPDKKDKNKKRAEEIKNSEQQEQTLKVETVDDILATIPLVNRLPEAKDLSPLKDIELDSDLVEKEDELLLPKIANNGTKPWVKYGRQVYVQPKFFKVAIVLKNIGLDTNVATAAIKSMPSNVSLSFSPYALNAEKTIKEARTAGHETYVDLLLSTKDVLKSDNGPLSMSLTLDLQGNLERIKQALATGAPIGGMVINDGVADKDNREQLVEIMKKLQKRGLLIADATLGSEISSIRVDGLGRQKADIIIDDGFNRKNMEEKIKLAESIAQNNGSVLIVATPKPVVLTVLNEWIKTFSPQLSYTEMKEQNITTIEKPFALVPLSNVVVE